VGVSAGAVRGAPLVAVGAGGGGGAPKAQAIGKPSANTKIAHRIGACMRCSSKRFYRDCRTRP
jgi:hypothetical protein